MQWGGARAKTRVYAIGENVGRPYRRLHNTLNT